MKKPKLPNPARLFHAGDPFWARLGKPIRNSEHNPFPDNGGVRDMTNGSKLALGAGVIAGGTAIGGPIGTAIAAGCVGVGVFVGMSNSHLRQRRLENLQSFAGDINARARAIKHKFELDANHSCSHNHHHHQHKHDNCGDEITHGITHPLHDGKKGFVAMNFVRYFTNAISGARASSPLVVREIADQSGRAVAGTAVVGVGMANDTAIAGIDGARAHYYAYHINNEEYKRYADIVKERDKNLGDSNKYYSHEESFKLLKDFLLLQGQGKQMPRMASVLHDARNIDDFFRKVEAQQKKYGKDTLPVTALAFFMVNFALISESKKESIPAKKVTDFLQESCDRFKVRDRRWSPRSHWFPYRNDVVSYGFDNRYGGSKSWEDISLRSWQIHQELEFDRAKIAFLLDLHIGSEAEAATQQSNHKKITTIRKKIDSIIDQDLQKTTLGRTQYQHIHDALMIEMLELGGLDAALEALAKLSRAVGDTKLSPTSIRERYSEHTYGHPHQELDGYAQTPAKALGALAHNITFAEIDESISGLIEFVARDLPHPVGEVGLATRDRELPSKPDEVMHKEELAEVIPLERSDPDPVILDPLERNLGPVVEPPNVQETHNKKPKTREVAIEEGGVKNVCCNLFDICK